MRVIALVKSLENVCCRYRLAAYRPFFAQLGCSLEIKPWPASWLSRVLLRRELGSADLLIVQRRLPPAWQLPLLRCVAPLLLFDFDDAVFLRDSFSPAGDYSAGRAQAFAAVTRTADVVVAGNAWLRDHASLWTAADKVEHIPTCVDFGCYAPASHTRTGPGVELVWIGSSSTLRGLEQIRPLLEELGRRCPSLSLKIICDRFLELSHLRVVPCRWAAATEAADLACSDIGFSWLPDDAWSRGKCGLKVLQYMAAGLPVIANPVGLQADLVRHGETGLLVRTPRELARAAALLARDPELRRRMGRAGRRYAREHFHVSVGGARWTELLRRLGASPGAQAAAQTQKAQAAQAHQIVREVRY